MIDDPLFARTNNPRNVLLTLLLLFCLVILPSRLSAVSLYIQPRTLYHLPPALSPRSVEIKRLSPYLPFSPLAVTNRTLVILVSAIGIPSPVIRRLPHLLFRWVLLSFWAFGFSSLFFQPPSFQS